MQFKKTRVNWTIDREIYQAIKQMSKKGNCSMSQIIETMVRRMTFDRVKILEAEKRECAIRINQINDEIKGIEEKRKGGN